MLKVYEDGMEKDSIQISNLRTKERMHQAMKDAGFEMKNEDELKADAEKANRVRAQKNMAMFHRKEYVRQQHLHKHYFRQEVMQDTNYNATSWIYKDKDWLHDNYDLIFRNEVIYKRDVLEYAKRFLIEGPKRRNKQRRR